MLVLTPKYGSQIDLDLLKKQKKEPLIKHRQSIDLNKCQNINEAYLTFLNNKDKYIIGYKLKELSEIYDFPSSLGEIDTLDVSWIDVSELESLRECIVCKAKHIIGLETWDVSNVKDMAYMFSECHNLESIDDISGWDVSNVENMACMFEECEKLESIGDISGWNVSNVKLTEHMFRFCENLKNIGDLSRWDVSNVVWMNSMFLGCKKLKNIGDLSRWDVSNVALMNSMFLGCKKLKNIGDIEKWNVPGDIGYMFFDSGIKHLPSWYYE